MNQNILEFKNISLTTCYGWWPAVNVVWHDMAIDTVRNDRVKYSLKRSKSYTYSGVVGAPRKEMFS